MLSRNWRSSRLITRNGWVDLQRPCINAARHTLRIDEPVASKIGSSIQAAHPVVAHGYNRRFLRPGLHDFLRHGLIDKHASRYACDRVLFRRPHIEQLDLSILKE